MKTASRIAAIVIILAMAIAASITVVTFFDVDLITYEDGSGEIGWCMPFSACDDLH